MKQGDIYLVRFHPAVGSELKRFRPAVVISDQVNRIDSRFTVIAPLTTNIKSKHPEYELEIKANPALEKDSLLLCWYLRTVDVTRLENKLGLLSKTDIVKMKQALKKLFI